MQEVIIREKAEEEVNKWLDYKKVYPSAREKSKDAIETLIDAIMYGNLTLDMETHKFTHILLIPFDNEKKLESLTYAARLNDKMLEPYMRGEDAGNGDARIIATISALTATAKGIIKALDSSDKKIAMAICTFFF